LVGTLVLTRFVAPHDYGEVGVAAVLVLMVQQFSTLGLGQYVIANPDADRSIAFHATFYHLLSGILPLLLLWLLGAWIGPMVEAPNAGRYLPGLIAAGVLDRLMYVPERVLIRDMRFAALSGARSAGDIAYSVVSVALAAAGFGAMSIVWGNLARALIRTALMILPLHWRDWIEPSRIRLQATRQLFAFGLPLAVAAVGTFASRRWDYLLVSRFFGPGVAGNYALAYNLADVPAIQVGEQVGDVLFPSFARLDAERRKEALISSLTLLSLVVFPLAVGLGAVAPTLIRLLLDVRWQPVGPMLVLLSALSITRPIGWTVAAYLKSRQKPRVVMWIEWLTVAVLLLGVATIGRLSPLWTCVAVGVAFGVQALTGLLVVRSADGISLFRLLGAVAGPLGACVALALAVVAVRYGAATESWGSALLALLAETVAGAIAYLITAFLVARDSSTELVRRVLEAFGRRAAPQRS
jgi:lipopolysaccharide exporter